MGEGEGHMAGHRIAVRVRGMAGVRGREAAERRRARGSVYS